MGPCPRCTKSRPTSITPIPLPLSSATPERLYKVANLVSNEHCPYKAKAKAKNKRKYPDHLGQILIQVAYHGASCIRGSTSVQLIVMSPYVAATSW